MEQFIGNMLELLSITKAGQLVCDPAFFMDIFLAIVLCLLQCILCLDINTLVGITRAWAFAGLKIKRSARDFDFQKSKQIINLATLGSTGLIHSSPKIIYKTNRHSDSNSRSDKEISSLATNSDKTQYLPSQLVEMDNKIQNNKPLIHSCIQLLTSHIENYLSKDLNFSPDDIKKSINTLKDYLESELLNTNSESTEAAYSTLMREIEDIKFKRKNNSLTPI